MAHDIVPVASAARDRSTFDRGWRGARRGPGRDRHVACGRKSIVNRILVAALLTSLVPVTVAAQAGTAACPPPATPSGVAVTGQRSGMDADSVAARGGTAAGDQVDIAIIASASAREIRFASAPDIRVRLCGGLDSLRVIERRNLPDRVVAGQTYRDVYIAVEILGRVDAACLARKLGVSPADTSGAPALTLAAGCGEVTVGGTSAAPAPGAPVRRPPGMEDAPGRAQATPARP